MEEIKLKSSKRKISLLVSTLVFIGAFSVSNSNYANNNAHAAVLRYKQASYSLKNNKITAISLNKTTDTLIVGKKDRLIATSVPGSLKNKAITWTSSDSNIVTVKNGEVKAIAAGNAVVTAALTDGSVSASCSITVNPVVEITGISLNKTSDTLVASTKETLTATITPGNATDTHLKWTSSDKKVARVENGVVTAVSEGTAVITAASQDGKYAASCTITVTPKVKVTVISLNKTSDTLQVGATDTLSAAITPSNATNQNLRWISSNKRIVKVENGVVTAVSEGTAIIIVTSPDGRYAASCTVTVTAPAQ